jgi:putative ABC transport system permease protein
VNWLGETIRIALASLRANKLRTLLTVIGVVIGISTIIGMLSLINGINRSVMTEFERLGPNVLYVTREEPGIHVGRGRRDRKDVTLEEVEALRRRCRSLKRISIVGEARGRAGYRGRKSGMLTIRGSQADYVDIANLDIDEGRFFDRLEGEKAPVCVLGRGVVETIFGTVSPLGKKVEIQGRTFRVLGTLKESGTMLGHSFDDTAIIPYRWYRVLFGNTQQEYAMASPSADVELGEAVDDLRLTMRLVRKIPLGEEDGFAVSTQETLVDTYKKLTASVYWVMRIVASIALLVSGVGIMNIMLVVVMERTAEVGLRKAVGAPRKAIMGQFLIESVLMTLTGGLVGVGLGYLIRLVVSSATPLPASVPIWAVPLSLMICCAVGVFFGLYPAVRASGLDPVRALRYE